MERLAQLASELSRSAPNGQTSRDSEALTRRSPAIRRALRLERILTQQLGVAESLSTKKKQFTVAIPKRKHVAASWQA